MMRGLRERKYLALLIALVVAALRLLRAGARFQTGIQCSGDPLGWLCRCLLWTQSSYRQGKQLDSDHPP